MDGVNEVCGWIVSMRCVGVCAEMCGWIFPDLHKWGAPEITTPECINKTHETASWKMPLPIIYYIADIVMDGTKCC